MANVKKYTRLSVFCLLTITLLADISVARMGGGFLRCRGGFHHSMRFFNPRFGPFYSNFQGIPLIIGPYDYQSNDYYTYHSRYDNFPNTTGSRYDNFPYSSQVQSPPSQGNTYNNYTYNYTYNYYGGTEGSTAQYGSSAHQRQLPQKTEVGIFYENGVTAFKNGNYAEAAKNFQCAIRPANKFMPLAYTQALFADKNYAQAIEQLRLALDKLSPEKNSILFPRFLYPNDQILLTQIDKLCELAGSDSDLQLLVGYQLFGVKKMDEAVKFLNKAKSNSVNEPAATKLLLMIEKAKTTINRSQTPA
jgi:tetratricopeptide (TPR) repeat protein